MHQRIVTGRIADLTIFSLVEFGTRVSFKIEGPARTPILCAIDGDIAREFIAHYCEGDIIAVSGFDEPRPSTAAANTPWLGRFRVCAVRAADDARLAAWGLRGVDETQFPSVAGPLPAPHRAEGPRSHEGRAAFVTPTGSNDH